MSLPATKRRSPVQERSQETVQRVLAAASALLASGVTVEALTTAQIATAAGLSVGGLYRFFPDKQAIVDAIAVHHMELFQEQMAGRMMLAIPPDPSAFLGAIIDGFVAYLEANPDFRILAFGAPGGGRYVSRPTRETFGGSSVLEAIREFVGEMYEVELSEDFGFRLRLVTEIGDRLLAYAFEQTAPDERAHIVAEAKSLLTSYLFAQP